VLILWVQLQLLVGGRSRSVELLGAMVACNPSEEKVSRPLSEDGFRSNLPVAGAMVDDERNLETVHVTVDVDEAL
jgi:hypothetical protein